MDIEALVAKITAEVVNELKQQGVASVDRLPPARRYENVQFNGNGKVCQAKLTGECAGVGCCSQLIPEQVRDVVKLGADRVGNTLGGKVDHDLAAMIDHTLLKADATQDEVLALCHEARQYKFASVCVNPGWVKIAAEALTGSGVKVCTVVGFPLGATTTMTKVMETRDAIASGAAEIDMVINIGALKTGS